MSLFSHTPPVTKNLLIINCLIFLLTVALNGHGTDLGNLFGLHFWGASDFAPWQFVSYMFLHANVSHLFFNMFALWMFGRIIERDWGEKRYLLFYLVCGIGAGLCQELWQTGEYYMENMDFYTSVDLGGGQVVSRDAFLNMWNTIGASGAVYGVLLGFGMSYPEERILIFPIPVPIKAKWFVAGYAAIELFSAFCSNGNVAHFAHLGGMLFGYLLLRHWKRQAATRRPTFSDWGHYTPRRESMLKRWSEKMRIFLRDTVHKVSHPNAADPHKTEKEKPEDTEKKRKENEEIDRILMKVRQSGYSSLTDEEKRRLFDRGHS